ncbi:CHASE2 domain-containing protein, partial [Limnohabitans sp.]|uniref:CHASE2 domain-containing protein n=1 Tax=Limnohabitans sp. TaxID=1907725 RepID=UPI00286F225C
MSFRSVDLWRELIALSLLSIALALGLSLMETFDRADQWGHDQALRLQLPRRVEDVVVVAVDAASLAQHGRWPWSREAQADLILRLSGAGARAIGWDLVLAESETKKSDRRLARALKSSQRVVLPVVREQGADGVSIQMQPLPLLADAAAGLGWGHADANADGVVRGLYLCEKNEIDESIPHFVQRVAELGHGVAVGTCASDEGLGYKRLVRFVTGNQPFVTLSASDVLSPYFDRSQVQDKWVLVGVTAAGLGSAVFTPLSQRPMPGVEFMAHALEGVLHDQLIRPLPVWGQALLCMLLALIPWTLLPRLSARLGLLWCCSVAALAMLLPILFLLLTGVALNTAAAAAVITLAYPIWAWRRLELATRYLDEDLKLMTAHIGALGPSPEMNALDVRREQALDDRMALQIARVHVLRQAVMQFEIEQNEMSQFISHDIRAPLEGALMQLKPLLGTEHGAYRQIMRAKTWADDFLQTTRLQWVEANSFQTLDVVALLHEAADELHPQLTARSLHLTREFPDEVIWVHGHFELLLRMMLNLLGNAIKYAPLDSTVVLSLVCADGAAYISVQDQGEGIAEDQLPRLFERYSRIESKAKEV